MQMNSKELKGFRDTLAKWHVADFKLADEVLISQKKVKGLQDAIDTDAKRIATAEEAGCVLGNLADIKSEMAEYEKKIQAEKDALAKIREEQTKALENGRALITDDIVNSINEYLTDIWSDEKEQALVDTLVKWFISNGAKDAQASDVKPFLRALGQKKASARQKCASGKHNGVFPKNTIKDIFLGAICEEPSMASALPTHKWVTIIEKKSKKGTK